MFGVGISAMRIVNYNLTYLILGWSFFLIGVFLGLYFAIKISLGLETFQVFPFIILFCFAFLGWSCIHCDYFNFLPGGIDYRKAQIFFHSKQFISIDEIDKIQLKEKIQYRQRKGFWFASIVLLCKNGHKIEIKELNLIEKQKKLLLKINERFPFHKVVIQSSQKNNQEIPDQAKNRKSSQLRESLNIVNWESGQIVVGIIGSVGLSIAYFNEVRTDKYQHSLFWFMVLWGAFMIYKVIRYRVHLNKVRKNINRLTNKSMTNKFSRN